MSKIAHAFEQGKAFIPFVTGGDPDLETTKELILALQESGADLIEIGIPFSDPQSFKFVTIGFDNIGIIDVNDWFRGNPTFYEIAIIVP